MKTLNQVSGFALAVLLLTETGLVAEPPQKKVRFVPNYIAIDGVTLSSPNGNSRGSLKKGTLVTARNPGTEILDVKTEDGRFGLAYSRYFSRLGSSIVITNEA